MAAFKAQAMARNLREHLELTLKGVSVKEANDNGFFPILLIKKGAEALYVKIEMLPDDAQHKDGLDLPQRLYSPHKVSILREEAASATEAELRERVTSGCASLGAKVRLLEKAGIAAATDPAAYDETGAALIAELGSDDRKQNPLTNSQ